MIGGLNCLQSNSNLEFAGTSRLPALSAVKNCLLPQHPHSDPSDAVVEPLQRTSVHSYIGGLQVFCMGVGPVIDDIGVFIESRFISENTLK